MKLRSCLSALTCASALLLGSGCQILPEAQPDPTRYFVLTAPIPGTAKSEGVSIGLRGLELPGYLRSTRTMVVAHGPNEISYRDYDRWAEPLDVGLTRVFSAGLVEAGNVGRVFAYPFPADQPRDLDLLLRVLRCEGFESDGERGIRFALSYEILRPGAGGEVLRRGLYSASPRSWNGEADTLAALLASAATEAARAVAADLP